MNVGTHEVVATVTEANGASESGLHSSQPDRPSRNSLTCRSQRGRSQPMVVTSLDCSMAEVALDGGDLPY